MSADIRERVISAISSAQRIPRESIRPEKTFEEMGLDSLDAMGILFALETEFDISIPDDAARSIRSVADAVRGIEVLMEQQRPDSK
ncbi:MAG: acyl carrier protein [Candidatus Korobacteraceae bacterium]